MLALGSRGDVQPLTALGLGLQRAGHTVRVAAATDYRELVTPYGLEFAPLVGSIRDFMDRQMVYAMLDEPENPLRFLTGMMDAVRPLVRRLVADVYAACRDADAVVVSTLGVYAGYDVAEALGIDLRQNGLDLCAPGPLRLAASPAANGRLGRSVRIGLTRAADRVLRFYERGNVYVSGPKRLCA